ncbi:MAG: LytTR family DNA-binding domain-containing protein [Bacteroidota bacterium]
MFKPHRCQLLGKPLFSFEQKLAVQDILFVEGMKDYLQIHTPTETIMTLLSFSKLEELLPVVLSLHLSSFYFPIQNLLNIVSNKSSVVTCPVISPR